MYTTNICLKRSRIYLESTGVLIVVQKGLYVVHRISNSAAYDKSPVM